VVSKWLMIGFMVMGIGLRAENAIGPANKWGCQVHCGELPRNNEELMKGVVALRKAGIQSKGMTYRKDGKHIFDKCQSEPGYETCYLVPKKSNWPDGFHEDLDASRFKINSPRVH